MARSLSLHDSLCRSPQHRDRTRTPRDAPCQTDPIAHTTLSRARTRAQGSAAAQRPCHATTARLNCYTEQHPEPDRELYSAKTHELRKGPCSSTRFNRATPVHHDPYAQQSPVNRLPLESPTGQHTPRALQHMRADRGASRSSIGARALSLSWEQAHALHDGRRPKHTPSLQRLRFFLSPLSFAPAENMLRLTTLPFW